MINNCILHYSRITCAAVLYCLSILIYSHLSGEYKKDTKKSFDTLKNSFDELEKLINDGISESEN